MNRLAAILMLFALAGCGTAPAAKLQAVELGAEVTLVPGATVSVKATEMEVRFVSVIEDSRCPRDVTCIWAGEVRVLVEVGSAQGVSKTEILEGASAVAGSYRVTLVRVAPQPTSTAKIAPQDYRVTLKIDRAG